MFPTLVRRLATAPKPQLTIHNNPFKTKKVWPPDFSKLSPHEQFKFEKKYKRRVKLASARPKWNKIIKLTQLFSITFVVIYSVLFMDWKDEHQPFGAMRKKFWDTMGSFSAAERYERRKVEDSPGPTTK